MKTINIYLIFVLVSASSVAKNSLNEKIAQVKLYKLTTSSLRINNLDLKSTTSTSYRVEIDKVTIATSKLLNPKRLSDKLTKEVTIISPIETLSLSENKIAGQIPCNSIDRNKQLAMIKLTYRCLNACILSK